jgi:hypothetical protein
VIEAFAKSQPQSRWEGNSAELLAEINSGRRTPFPIPAEQLANCANEIAPLLEKKGIEMKSTSSFFPTIRIAPLQKR